MSIEKLEEIRDEFVDREDSRWMDHDDCLNVYKFMQETIATFKDQSDMIAELQKELAKKMKEIDQKESYYPKKEVIL